MFPEDSVLTAGRFWEASGWTGSASGPRREAARSQRWVDGLELSVQVTTTDDNYRQI